MTFEIEKFLNTPIYAWNQSVLFSDVSYFMDFSERNIEWQKRVALREIDQQVELTGLEEPDRGSYRRHLEDGVEHRFGTVLPMRIRYAGLASFVGTVEWSMKTLEERATFKIPRKRNGRSEAAHTLSVFSKATGLLQDIDRLETCVFARNCILHNSGILKGYKEEASLRLAIATVEGLSVSDWHFIGACVRVERGFVERLCDKWHGRVQNLFRVASERGLIK